MFTVTCLVMNQIEAFNQSLSVKLIKLFLHISSAAGALIDSYFNRQKLTCQIIKYNRITWSFSRKQHPLCYLYLCLGVCVFVCGPGWGSDIPQVWAGGRPSSPLHWLQPTGSKTHGSSYRNTQKHIRALMSNFFIFFVGHIQLTLILSGPDWRKSHFCQCKEV